MPNKDIKRAIKMLDDIVSSMGKLIGITRMHKQKAIELRDILSKGKISKITGKARMTGQEVGWLVEHPAQAIGKVYDAYQEAVKAVDDENKAWEQALEKQKEAKEAQDRNK